MRHPTHEHIPAISIVFANALQDDPLHAYFFPERQRFASNRVLYDYIARTEFDDLVVTSSACEGVAVWKGPGSHSSISQNVTAHLKDSIRLTASLGPGAIAKLIRHHRWTSSIHRALMPDPHWYLRIIAVDPTYQRRGMGASLLRSMLEEADATGLPTYLETQNPANIPMYEHFGFHEIRSERIPHTLLIHTCMIRHGHARH